MSDESPKAREYESRYPGTGIPEAQKEERMERLTFKEERQSLCRTMRNRGVTFAGIDNPWLNSLERERTAPNG